jgi:hypothetical protein
MCVRGILDHLVLAHSRLTPSSASERPERFERPLPWIVDNGLIFQAVKNNGAQRVAGSNALELVRRCDLDDFIERRGSCRDLHGT